MFVCLFGWFFCGLEKGMYVCTVCAVRAQRDIILSCIPANFDLKGGKKSPKRCMFFLDGGFHVQDSSAHASPFGG